MCLFEVNQITRSSNCSLVNLSLTSFGKMLEFMSTAKKQKQLYKCLLDLTIPKKSDYDDIAQVIKLAAHISFNYN